MYKPNEFHKSFYNIAERKIIIVPIHMTPCRTLLLMNNMRRFLPFTYGCYDGRGLDWEVKRT